MKTPEELRSDWRSFMDTLVWKKGELDVSSWHAFLRAASCEVNQGDAIEEVARRIISAGGAARQGKIVSQARRAYNFVGTKPKDGGTWRPRPGWEPSNAHKPKFDPAKLAELAEPWRGKIDAVWLGNRSKMDPALVTAGDFLAALYLQGENVLLFSDYKSQGQVYWKSCGATSTEDWEYHSAVGPQVRLPANAALKLSGPEGVWFLAQPVDGRVASESAHRKMSRRSEESVTSWRYLVLESDEASADDWLAALVQLPLRIAAIYTSGGKSIHALVKVDAPSKSHWDAERDLVLPTLVTIGGDPAALTAVRLTRLPGCTRAGRPQKLLYLNPAPLGLMPICGLPPKRDVVEDYGRYAESLQATDEEDCPGWREQVVHGLEHYAPASAGLAAALRNLEVTT